MKKLLFYAAVVAMALSACAKDPEAAVSFDGDDTIDAPATGTSVTIKLKANYAWTATIDGTVKVTVDPSQGNGNADVAITVAANESDKPLEGSVSFSATGGGTTASKVISITQAAAPVISVDTTAIADIPVAGESYKVKVNSNYAWAASTTGTTSVTIAPESGAAGTTEVTITVAENKGKEPVAGTVVFTAAGGGTSATAEVALAQLAELTEVEWGGVTYPVKKMKDGNYWFVKNLRYVPEGKTVSSDLTAIANGIWYPINAATKKLTNEADTVAAKGYLYNVEAALGVAAGTVTTENCLSYEGARGLCPEGWHIPTLDELANLVGRVALSKYDLNATPGPIATAAYWDTAKSNSYMTTANEDGFNITPFDGFVNVTATGTTGTVLNTMSYYISSAAYVKNDAFNKQFFAIMANKTNGTCNGAAMNYRSGAPVRCVKDH